MKECPDNKSDGAIAYTVRRNRHIVCVKKKSEYRKPGLASVLL